MHERPDVSVEDDQMHFEDTDTAAGSSDQKRDNQGIPSMCIFEKGELLTFRGNDGVVCYRYKSHRVNQP